MARAFIYSFQNTTSTKINVYYIIENPTVIDYDSIPNVGIPGGQPPPDITLATACQPGTTNRLRYYSKTSTPFATYVVEPNSTYCGYVPPSCDIQLKDFTVTDETVEGANNGTINIFAVSSFMPITYYLTDNEGLNLDNQTGYFTGLAPNDYSLSAIDANGCVIQQFGTVLPFDNTKTHYKYRLQFESIANEGVNSETWQVRFYDLLNNYDADIYPLDVNGSSQPLLITQELSDEDKFSAIAVKNVDIELLYDGLTFTPDEFNNQQWYIEIYRDDQIEFKGYLLPDEVQDYYSDPEYPITLKANDGLPSLRGNKWGNGTGGNGYTTDQIPQFGLFRWGILVKQCLDQLGYDYGVTSLVSSLQYNETYNQTLWADIATWSDILYGEDTVPNDTYDCLELLLQGMGLTIMQHKGEFKLVNWNTLSYANNGVVTELYNRSFYQYTPDFLSTGNVLDLPLVQPIGHGWQLQPINPVQSLRFDKAYNIKGKADFNILALLYPNPSFEIGAVEGGLPFGWSNDGTISASLHQDNSAYDGRWVFRVSGQTNLQRLGGPGSPPRLQGLTQLRFMDDNNRWTALTPIYIDQENKAVQISFNWRPVFFDNDKNAIPTFAIIFDPDDGPANMIYCPNYKDPDTGSGWLVPAYGFPMSYSPDKVSDYIEWQSFSINTDKLPFSGKGMLYIAFRAPLVLDNTDDSSTVGRIGNDFVTHTIDYDNLQISLSDGSESYSKQTGESHLINTVKNNPSTKEVQLSLFTYPQNKRVAGNIFTNDDYATGEVSNKWSYALRTTEQPDRLAAIISKGLARAYQRNLYFFEGDVQANRVDFYGMFTLRFYEGRIFMPYSVKFDCLNNIASIVIVEIDDSEQQAIYKYVPIYEKSARKNTN